MKKRDAKRYVYGVIAAMLQEELKQRNPQERYGVVGEREGWIYGGIDNDADAKVLTETVREVIASMEKKSLP